MSLTKIESGAIAPGAIAESDLAINVYTTTEIDTALGLKANQSTTYTKTEVDTSLGLKANTSSLGTLASLSTIGTSNVTDGAITNAKIASGVDASKLTTGLLPTDRIQEALGYGNIKTLSAPNLNTVTSRGVYVASAATNSPDTSNWIHLLVSGNGSDQIQQRVRQAVYAGGGEWFRESTNGGTAWSAWVQIGGNYTPVNKAGDTMTGRLNIQNGGFGGLILNKGQGSERVAPEMYSLPIYTQNVGGNNYLNTQAKIGTLINNGSTSLLHGRIVRHGDLNYAGQVIVIDFFIHSWGPETNNFCFFGRESAGMGYTGNFATDSSGNVYYYDTMLWEQQTYLYIYDMYNFTFAPAAQSYNSALPWRGVSSNASLQYEVTRGT